MNKKIAKYLLALATIALAGGGCEVNDFNDKLDGFEEASGPQNVQTIPLTFSAEDYSAVASNKTNANIAIDMSKADSLILVAIGVNKFFTDNLSRLYLPAFLDSTYPYLDNGSAVQVSFIHKDKGSDILEKALQNQYTLESEDYDAAWGAGNSTPFFTNDKPADEFMPAVLKAKVAGAAAGDYAIATYAFSNEEPGVSAQKAVNTPVTRAAVTVKKISEIDFTNKEKGATAEGIVIGLHAQGVLFQDESGIALWYNGAETFYALGDKIQVTGDTELRYGVNQFSKGATSKYMGHPAGEFTYPTIDTTIDKDNIATYTGINKHVKMIGELLVDGNFLNVTIDGITTHRGSLSYVFPAMDIKSLGGKQIEVTGYYIGTSGSSTKNFTMMVTGVKEVGSADDITAAGVAATKAGNYTCKGIVVGLYNKGFLMNDGTGNILVYENKTPTVELGTLATVKGDTEIRYSMAQFKSTATIVAGAKLTATLPTPTVLDGAAVEAYMTAPVYTYAKFEGKLSKRLDGDRVFYEVKGIEGTEKYGSLSYPLTAQVAELDKLLNKTVSVTGYLIGSNTSTGYFSVMFGSIEQIISFPTETRYAVYAYNGSAWTAVATKDAITVNESDYLEMGLPNTYFDKTNSPDKYVRAFLNKNYPYAQVDQIVTAFYNYKEAATYTMGGVYKFDGTVWSQNTLTEQYVKTAGEWKFDPSVVITLIPDYKAATQAMKDFFQLGSDYVWENIDTPMGVTEKGKGYVSSFGNNEYYAGTSAYNVNVDLRPSAAVKQYPDGYAGMTDEQITALMTKRVCREVFPAMLKKQYPEAKPLSGVNVTYTINFGVYTGPKLSECTHSAVFNVVNTGEFEFASLKIIKDGKVVEVDE